MDNNWNMVPEDVLAVMGVVDTFMQWDRKVNSHRSYFKYHPSEFGQCLRKVQFRRYAELGFIQVVDEEIDSQKLRLFDKGHNMHSRWVSYFERIGVLRGFWDCTYCGTGIESTQTRYGEEEKLGVFKPDKCDVCGSVCFDYAELAINDKELNMSGHVDMVLDFSNFDSNRFKEVKPCYNIKNLPQKPIVVDMKTCNDASYSKILRMGPSLAYQVQLTIYANVLDCAFGLLIYENKNNSKIASFKIHKHIDTVFRTIKKQAQLMNEMVDHKLLPPPRPEKKDSYECRYCPFASICKKSSIWGSPTLNETRTKFYGLLL